MYSYVSACAFTRPLSINHITPMSACTSPLSVTTNEEHLHILPLSFLVGESRKSDKILHTCSFHFTVPVSRWHGKLAGWVHSSIETPQLLPICRAVDSRPTAALTVSFAEGTHKNFVEENGKKKKNSCVTLHYHF